MTKRFFLFFFTLCLITGAEFVYLYKTKSITKRAKEIKKEIAKICSIGDIAVANETKIIRQRSSVDLFSVFSESPELLEYFPSTFVYAPSCNLKNNPSRIDVE